jgi:hypothetical protein
MCYCPGDWGYWKEKKRKKKPPFGISLHQLIHEMMLNPFSNYQAPPILATLA